MADAHRSSVSAGTARRGRRTPPPRERPAPAAAPIVVALVWLWPPFAAGLVLGPVQAAWWWHRRPRPEAPPGMPAPASLAELAATEAPTRGQPVPTARITTGRSILWRRGSLEIGL